MNYKIGGCKKFVKIINLFRRLIKISLKTKNELMRVNYVGNFKIRRGFKRMVSNKPQRPKSSTTQSQNSKVLLSRNKLNAKASLGEPNVITKAKNLRNPES